MARLCFKAERFKSIMMPRPANLMQPAGLDFRSEVYAGWNQPGSVLSLLGYRYEDYRHDHVFSQDPPWADMFIGPNWRPE